MRGAQNISRLQARDAQRLIGLLGAQLLPALAAGLLVYVRSRHAGTGLLLFAATLGASHVLWRLSYPLHLIPAVRVVLLAAGAPLGAASLLALRALGGPHVAHSELIPPTIGALLIAALGAWVQVRLEAERPIRMAVIGASKLARGLAAELRLAGVHSYQVVGWLGAAEAPDSGDGMRHLGALELVRSAVAEEGIELLVCGPEASGHAYHEVAGGCLDLPVRMIDASQLYEELLGHVPVATIDAAWYRYLMHPRYRPGSPASKRLVDLVLGSAAALLALPVLALVVAAIRLGDGGPVLYRQRRVGERGREFEMLKLRTMRLDAEAPGFPRWSAAGDERVTIVGRLLRRLHIDELPQLWNVLRGEMTLVGPRPERPELVASLERQFAHYERRHLVKPGITGWAQIRCGYSGSEVGTAWKLCHDLYYLKHRSLLADLLIMAETVLVIARDAHRTIRVPDRQFILGARVGTDA